MLQGECSKWFPGCFEASQRMLLPRTLFVKPVRKLPVHEEEFPFTILRRIDATWSKQKLPFAVQGG